MTNQIDLPKLLRESGHARLDPNRAATIHTLLLDAYDQQQTSGHQLPSPSLVGGWLHLRMAYTLAAISLVVIFGVATTSAAANAAKPGDNLFTLDRLAERVRLALTAGETAKAEYQAHIAEERLEEQAELEVAKSDQAGAAADHADDALNRAIESIVAVQKKQAGKPGKSATALSKVETKLLKLREEHATPKEKLKASAVTRGTTTNINVRFGQSRWEWTTSVTDRSALVTEIATRTNQPAADIEAVLQLKVKKDKLKSNHSATTKKPAIKKKSRRNQRSQRVTNSANTTNTSVATTPVTTIVAQPKIRVEIDLKKRHAEIMTTVNGQTERWELSAVSKAQILHSIALKTGLTVAEITADWDFQQAE